MKIYNEKIKLDIMKEPLFFGKGKNIQRYDIMKYPMFYQYGEEMDENFWKPAEIDLSDDNKDFKNLYEAETRINTMNLKRQIVLDSIQGRSPLQLFGRVCTNSAFEYALTRLQYQETNHSDTYSYILRNVYDNPSDVFDTILDDEIISKHTKSITKAYEEFNDAINKWECDNEDKPSLHEMKVYLWKALIAWNIIEGIRFFVSFACTFAFAENKKLLGNAQELKLIARDEITHLKMSQKCINILKDNEEEGFQEVIKECQEYTTEMYREATENEEEWGEYLFKKGSMIGLNADILSRYMRYITNSRLRAIKEPKMFKEITQNPLPWMDSWLGQSREEVLPQELEITDYKIGVLSDMEEEDWDDI